MSFHTVWTRGGRLPALNDLPPEPTPAPSPELVSAGTMRFPSLRSYPTSGRRKTIDCLGLVWRQYLECSGLAAPRN